MCKNLGIAHLLFKDDSFAGRSSDSPAADSPLVGKFIWCVKCAQTRGLLMLCLHDCFFLGLENTSNVDHAFTCQSTVAASGPLKSNAHQVGKSNNAVWLNR